MPNLYIIAGCNGAGKTTASFTILRALIMNVKETDINELSEKILEGLKKAIRKLVETSAQKNEELIIGDKDGKISSVPAKDLLHTLDK